MYLLFLLTIGPIVWAIVGLCRGRMPISQYRELKPPHLKRFAVGLILAPLIVLSVCSLAYLVGASMFDLSRQNSMPILIFGMVSLPLALAVLLSRAKKYSKPIREKMMLDTIVIPDADVSSSYPDFSNLNDQND